MRCIAALILCMAAAACGHSTISASAQGQGDESIFPPSFALASDFPSDIVIPGIDGMRSTAFVVSTSSPAGVLAIDIDSNPMRLSADFAGLISPEGSGIPSRLLVSAIDEAFLLTSTSIISFNPIDGSVYEVEAVLAPVDIGSGRTNSDGSQAAATITPSYPGGIAGIGETLFIATANFTRTQSPAVARPGTVLAYRIADDHTLSRAGHIVTSCFNPTGLSVRNGAELVITDTGVIDIVDAGGVPRTPSGVDIADPGTLAITSTIELGMVGASFHDVAITSDGSRGFVGSSAYGHVYEIDLINRQVLRGLGDPIVVSDASDYVSDVALSVDEGFLFAASFEQSAVYPFNLSVAGPSRGDGFAVGYPSGVTEENPSGANTGAGPMAVRPGSRGVDYEGADLFILTGYPGALVAVETDAPAQAWLPTPDADGADDTPAPEPPQGNDSEPCQGFAQSVNSVSYGSGAGFGQAGFPDIVLGPPRGAGAMSGSMHVLSLGKNGTIVLDLGSCPAIDGPGADFIVFENAFYIGGNSSAPYAEIGIVGVGSDGANFVEFDCHSDGYPYDGCAGWHPVYSHPDNDISPFGVDAAGGDAFDLADVGIGRASYIRIRDAKGTGGGGTAGFDLDAVAVVNGRINNQ